MTHCALVELKTEATLGCSELHTAPVTFITITSSRHYLGTIFSPPESKIKDIYGSPRQLISSQPLSGASILFCTFGRLECLCCRLDRAVHAYF
jgi:hypothetical protein